MKPSQGCELLPRRPNGAGVHNPARRHIPNHGGAVADARPAANFYFQINSHAHADEHAFADLHCPASMAPGDTLLYAPMTTSCERIAPVLTMQPKPT